MSDIARQISSTGYRLHYFDSYARGETPRMLFKLGGRPFEDVRVVYDDWEDVKPTTPMGQLPYLEKDGQVLAQSNAINRFLAKKFGLAGKGVWEEALADMVVDTVDDMWKGCIKVIRATEETKEEEQNIYSDHVDTVLPKVEKLLEQNNGGDGFFVGKSLTWADVAVYNLIDFADRLLDGRVWEKYPKLAAFRERFEMEPKIEKYLQSRPVRPF